MAEARSTEASARRLAVGRWFPFLKEVLAQQGSFRWKLEGRSMEPTLPAGCELDIVPLPPRVRPGALVVFVAEDTLVVHRLVGQARARWITQGDGRRSPDSAFDPAQALGVVRAARVGSRQCWPPRLAALGAARWLARYHLLRAWRRLRRG